MANLRGRREGRVVHLWVSQAITLDCTGVKLDTPPYTLVAPNGYMGARARIYKCGGHQALSHREGRKNMITVAGIDVGKANLDVSVSGGQVVRFDNTTAGITKLIKHLNDEDTALALCEPTGGYERMLTSRLHQCEIAVQVVHPGRVRAFAKACGYEAKTDPLDAQVLARYGEVFPEADTWEPDTDPHRQELKDLLRQRRQFIDQRVQEKGRLDKGISTTIARSTKRHIAWLEKEIARLDREYQTVLKDNPALAELSNLYRTVPGVGPLTAATLVAYLPELGHWDSKGLTSLVGLAPWSRDSGKKRGHRAIRGGRGLVRRTLCMCA